MEVWITTPVYVGLGLLILLFRGVPWGAKIALFLSLVAFRTKVYDDFSLIHAWIAIAIIPICLRRNPASLVLILLSFAVLTLVQFLLFDHVVRSIQYLSWSRKLPGAFAILVVFVYMGWTYARESGPKLASLINYVGVAVIGFTVVLAILFANGVIDDKFDLWQDNPNDTSLICAAAWLHYLFHYHKSGPPLNTRWMVFAVTVLTIAITVMASSRWLSIFVVCTFIWSILRNRRDARQRAVRINPRFFFFGISAAILLTGAWAAFSHLLTGSFLQLNFDMQANGIKPALLWEGFQGYAPLRSSVGYRINGIMAAIGSLVQSGGLGIGLGRAVAVNEMISGYPGSLHVVWAEWLLELGLVFPAIVWLILRPKLNGYGLKVVSAATVTALLSMMAQTTGYLTHYFTWFVFVSLVFHYRPTGAPVPQRAHSGTGRQPGAMAPFPAGARVAQP